MGAVQPPLLAAGLPAWPRFFFDQLLPEPHSTKQYEDAVSWALETDPETMIAEREGRDAPRNRDAAEALCRSIRCPTLVIHGTEDRCQPVAIGQQLAELTGGTLAVLEALAICLRAASRSRSTG